MRYFNTEGLCNPEEHYMVRIDDRLEKIKRLLVDRKKYFVINRGRQYGKTTTLKALAKYLEEDYIAFSLDFQMMSTSMFDDSTTFAKAFADKLLKTLRNMKFEDKELFQKLLTDFQNDNLDAGLDDLFDYLKIQIGDKTIVEAVV